MEFGERKRKRKSQSFKLVTDEDCDPSHAVNSSCKDANGETKDAAVPDVWLGDDGMEIKRQITGMMRLLSDKTGRVYQRVGTEPGSSTSELQDRHLSWVHQPPVLSLVSEDHQSSNWSATGDLEPPPSTISRPIHNGPGCGQYSTRSRTLKILKTKDLIRANERNADVLIPAVQETPCCMCNCKGTLQAILYELRTMRRLMQTQKASFGRQEQTASPYQPRLGPSSTSRHMPRKRRPVYKVAQLSVSSTRRAALSTEGTSALKAAPTESGKREECEKLDSSTANVHPISCDASTFPAQNDPVAQSTLNPLLNQFQESQALETEVREPRKFLSASPNFSEYM